MGRLEPVNGTNIIELHNGEEIRLGHTWNEVAVLKRILDVERPQCFVEIGVHEGGLSYLLLPYLFWQEYIGIEIDLGLVQNAVKARYALLGRELIGVDCFDPKLMESIGKLKNKLIYCDGGNKVKELHAYKDVCLPGDLLFTHDYYDGVRPVLEVDQPHGEVLPEDIADITADECFELYDQDTLKTTRIQGWRKL